MQNRMEEVDYHDPCLATFFKGFMLGKPALKCWFTTECHIDDTVTIFALTVFLLSYRHQVPIDIVIRK